VWLFPPIEEYCIIVLVDADHDNCIELKGKLIDLHNELLNQPSCVLFRIAVEEMESWFIADIDAVRSAYPHAKIQKIEHIPPDSIVGAWELLAETLGKKRGECKRSDKIEWAKKISPHLDLESPRSTSLHFFIEGIQRKLEQHPTIAN